MARSKAVTRHRIIAALLGATALIAPAAAQAQSARHARQSEREAALEARLARLEAELTEMRAALQASRAQQNADAAAAAQRSAEIAEAAKATAAAATAKSDATAAKVAALEAKPAPEGMRSGNTTIKLGGFVKLVASNSRFADGSVATNSLGRDFYLAQTIPVGGKATTDTDFSAKQTRLWLNLASTVAGHQVKGYVETDFQVDANAAPAITGGGSQRTTNGYTLALRRAWLQVDRVLIGQEWSNFQYVAALPESTDYVGGVEGTVFSRQPQIRYTAPLSKAATLSVSVENPESATATLGTATMVENGTDHLPDATARLTYAGTFGELSLAGLVRQIRVDAAGAGLTQGGYGLSGAGKLWLNGAKTADLRLMLTYGRDISRYVGLNFAPDAVYVPTRGVLEHVNVLAAMAAVRVPLAEQWRVNLMGAYQKVDYASALPLASIAAYNKRAFSVGANLFYSPVKNVDVGIEYRHGERELVSGAKGQLDRVEFAAKYGF